MRQKLITILLFMISVANMYSQQGIISDITFTGNKKTKASFLNRIIKVKKGDVLDTLKIRSDIERIKRLDGVAHAEYSFKKENGDYLVNYDLKENFSIIPGLRVGQANDDSFSFRASVFEFNGLGRNIIAGGFYQREVFDSYGLFIEHPYLFTNKLGLGVNYQDLTTQQPIFSGTGANEEEISYTNTRRGPEVTLFYEHNFNNRFEFGAKIFEEEYLIIDGDEDNEELFAQGFLNANTSEPKLDKQLIRGSYEYVDIDLEYHNVSGVRNLFDAQYFFGSNDELQTEYILKNTSQYFKRVGKKGNWASQLQLELSNAVEGSDFVPIVIDNQLNTRGAGNTVDRGTAAFAINTEYRHTFIEKDWFVLQGNAFVDASGVRRQNEEFSDILSKDRFRVNPGIGFRLIHKRIFNAVIRIDYGVNVTGNGDSGIVFGIGQYF